MVVRKIEERGKYEEIQLEWNEFREIHSKTVNETNTQRKRVWPSNQNVVFVFSSTFYSISSDFMIFHCYVIYNKYCVLAFSSVFIALMFVIASNWLCLCKFITAKSLVANFWKMGCTSFQVHLLFRLFQYLFYFRWDWDEKKYPQNKTKFATNRAYKKEMRSTAEHQQHTSNKHKHTSAVLSVWAIKFQSGLFHRMISTLSPLHATQQPLHLYNWKFTVLLFIQYRALSSFVSMTHNP